MQAPEKPKTSPRRNPVDATPYHQHDPRDKPRKEREEVLYTTRCYFWPREREAFGQLGAYVNALADVSVDKPRWREVIERVNSLAGELKVDREQVYFMALTGLIEKYEEAMSKHADESPTARSSREMAECTEEEFDAILEADRLEPELVESQNRSF